MAIKISNHFMFNCLDSYLNGATIKALAIASDGNFDPAASDYDNLNDIAANIASHEFDGANYARPTVTIVGPTESDANDNVVVDANDIVLSSLGAGTNPIEGWLFYVDGATDSDRKVIGWYGYTSAQTPNGADFTVTIGANGLFTLAQSA